jgi:hypothetical protein
MNKFLKLCHDFMQDLKPPAKFDFKLTPEQHDQFLAWNVHITETCDNMEMICDQPPTGFEFDEQVIFCLPGVSLMEPRAVRYTRGGSAGSSIRIMKGLSIRTGGWAGRSESVEELRTIDRGTLVLTTKRLVFLGQLRTNSVILSDIISIQSFTDAIDVHRERKQKVETYVLPDEQLTIRYGHGAGLPVVGRMLAASINHAKINYEFGLDRLPEHRQWLKERNQARLEDNGSNVVPLR